MSGGQICPVAVASLHILDGGKQLASVPGNNHSCGRGDAGTNFKKANLTAVALVAPPPAGRQVVGKGLARGLKIVGKGLTKSWNVLVNIEVPVSGAEAVMNHMRAKYVHRTPVTPVIVAGDFNITRHVLLSTTGDNDSRWGAVGNDKDFIMPCAYLLG